MKADEIRKLKPGRRVEILMESTVSWTPGIFLSCADYGYGDNHLMVYVKRDGNGPSGRPYTQRLCRMPHQVRLPAVQLAAVPANIYADWLDDHDEPAAADKLRKAFPLGPSEEP